MFLAGKRGVEGNRSGIKLRKGVIGEVIFFVWLLDLANDLKYVIQLA
jgi:hypothetical protein